MDEEIKKLKGSKLRDDWRYLHKQQLPADAYGMDGDFLLIEPHVGIFACLDIKREDDDFTWTEGIGYHHFIRLGIPVYAVRVFDVKEGVCNIYKFPSREVIAICSNWTDYEKWESALREEAKNATTP